MEHSQSFVTILLVEDNAADVELTREAFRYCRTPVQLISIPNAMDALNYLRGMPQNSPALILLDLNLPCWDGKKFLKEIKADNGLKKIPVIVITTSSAHEDVIECYNLHANSYIVKPIDIEQYFQKIKNLEAFWLDTALLSNLAS